MPFPEREASELGWIISMGDGCAMRAVGDSLYHSSSGKANRYESCELCSLYKDSLASHDEQGCPQD
jgi:hypothetical protein